MAFKPKKLKILGILAISLAVVLASIGAYEHFFQPTKKIKFPFTELFLLSLVTGIACIYLSKLKR